MSDDDIRNALTDRNLAEVARRLSVTRAYLHAIRAAKVPLSESMRQRLTEYLSNTATA